MQTSPISDDVKITLTALLNLIRLLSAELVAGRHRDDVAVLEQAIRAKLNHIDPGVCSAEATARGLAYAHELVGPVLAQVRAQAAAARSGQVSGGRGRKRAPLH